MRIHSICVVKNEADIIGEVLLEAAKWSDFIYVLDNGSEDGTWERVGEIAAANAHVIPYRREFGPFRNALRAEVFAEFRGNGTAGDWWCRLDADEIYIDSPRSFLAEIPRRFNRVWSATYHYYFTDLDLARWQEEPARYGPNVPVTEKLRYYLNNWSELRFVRQEPGMVWRGGWPKRNPIVFPRRIRLRHYQFRFPEQIQARLDTRREAAERGEAFRHELTSGWAAAVSQRLEWRDRRFEMGGEALDWRDRIVPAAALHVDRGDGNWIASEELMPPLPRAGWLSVLRGYVDRGLVARLRAAGSKRSAG